MRTQSRARLGASLWSRRRVGGNREVLMVASDGLEQVVVTSREACEVVRVASPVLPQRFQGALFKRINY